MTLISRERFSAEMISLLKTSERFGGRGGRRFLPQDSFKPFNHEILDRSPPLGRRDFRSLKNFIRKIDRRLHPAINTEILFYVKHRVAVEPLEINNSGHLLNRRTGRHLGLITR